MKYDLIHQVLTEDDRSTFIEFVRDVCAKKAYDSVSFASAYATVEGTIKFLSLFNNDELNRSSWLIGLDDYFTQPGALERLSITPNAALRVCKPSNSRNRIFHPKIVLLGDSGDPTNCSLIVGSSNLTLRGLTKNVEASGVLHSESAGDSLVLNQFWERYWLLGESLSTAYFGSYRTRYSLQKERRRRAGLLGLGDDPRVEAADAEEPARRPGEILGNDAAEVLPEDATVCWIEVGKNTALGRELEFKAEQARFFGLPAGGGAAANRGFRLSDNTVAELRLKYQENAMWRLQMNNNVPEVAAGLRPLVNGRLGRSPLVAVFRRLPNNLMSLNFLQETSKEYDEIKNESRRVGALGSTSARQYGWY